ncbi:MAG TPA: TIGR03067 domain-containing protein [Gemmataceae bacterium]|jgi:uncharacterized protein (TIGR03067 family)|nr:TIGR03067 domain-containing protein [Gemmataceae bacterium]
MTSSLLIGLAVVVAAPAPKEAPKKDMPTLVGVWNVESAIKGGKADNSPPGGTVEFMPDGKMAIKENGKDINGTFTSDAKKEQPEIDLNLEAGGMTVKMLGIYKLDGDKLLICLNFMGDRPTKLESPDGALTVLLTLKRTKKD